MAISIDLTMFDTTNPKLLKSADALESALAQLGKNATPFAADNNDNTVTATTVSSNGSGFDEWLANDFQLGALSNDDVTSLTSSPYSALDDSPVLGFESFSSVLGPSLFDMSLGFNTVSAVPVSTAAANTALAMPVQIKTSTVVAPAPVLSTAAVQQAAAALNIPWSRDLELAVLAQAQAAAALPTTAALSVNTTPAMIIPKIEPMDHSFAALARPIHSVGASSPVGNKKRALTPDEEPEEVIAKRAKNTDAARRSRLKKLARLETLESKVSELEANNNRLTMKVAILETEKNGHLVKDAEQSTRIAQLEAKLAEAHALLTSRA
ncbi:hypothetical protein EDD11_001991 [Mortierella claussenii]|nr:hypothetical protein EDD11_001991 [Mortierella claussenii]